MTKISDRAIVRTILKFMVHKRLKNVCLWLCCVISWPIESGLRIFYYILDAPIFVPNRTILFWRSLNSVRVPWNGGILIKIVIMVWFKISGKSGYLINERSGRLNTVSKIKLNIVISKCKCVWGIFVLMVFLVHVGWVWSDPMNIAVLRVRRDMVSMGRCSISQTSSPTTTIRWRRS